jgi:thioredoxin
MFSSPKPNMIKSDEGFSIEVLDRDHIRYAEGPKTMRIYAEVLMGLAGWIVYPDTIKSWDPPYEGEEINREKRDEILDNIKRAFRFWGYEIQVYESELAYHGPWPVLSKDEIDKSLEEIKQESLKDKAAGKELLSAKIVKVDAENFTQEVLSSPMPVLVFFWMPAYTGLVYKMSYILEEASIEWEGRIKICKLNYDEAKDVARKYQIQTIPSMILFENGEPVKKIVGSWPKEAFVCEFRDWL